MPVLSLYLVDLMPVFWAILLAFSVSAASRGTERLLLGLTVPGLIGFGFYAAGYPARTQLFAAVGTAAIVAAVRFASGLVRRVRRSFTDAEERPSPEDYHS